jgi:diaminohydroxyphosphoribosylaminopyrimidine deaminase/5-amino-6-(5-phosphoribosylamino)uracil reductase
VATRFSPHEAMDRAVSLAARGPAHGPNPRVGAVLTDADGVVLGEGFHEGAGTAHAEVAAIADARARGAHLAGATAYVTLEPCNHSGRTGPCTEALLEAGVATVRYAVPDPNPQATGGAAALSARGVHAEHAPHHGAEELNARWLTAVRQGRPYVIAKWAQTLDGFIAATDGSSVWITGDVARNHAHVVRSHVDALLVGTGTVVADDPELSARPAGRLAMHQPLRVVMGLRETPGARVWRDDNAVHFATHEPADVLDSLWARDVRTVVVEGGGEVLSAFVNNGLVNEINVYIAPALLGDGIRAIHGLGITTMAGVLRARRVASTALGPDTLVAALLGKE